MNTYRSHSYLAKSDNPCKKQSFEQNISSISSFVMANSILRVDDHNKAIYHAFGLLSLVLLMQKVGANEIKVGDGMGWTVPTNPNDLPYKKWAEATRFQKGDSLLFVYQPDKDSVLQVNKEDYDKCNTAAPIATFDDGNTSFKLNQSGGQYYFISGIEKNCLSNEKVIIIVLSDKNKKPSASPPSPPPSGPSESIPSPAPVGEEPPPSPLPPSGASSVFVSFISSVSAFVIGSSVILVL